MMLWIELGVCRPVYGLMIDHSVLQMEGNERAYSHTYPSLQFPRGARRKTTCERRRSVEFLKAKWKINGGKYRNTLNPCESLHG